MSRLRMRLEATGKRAEGERGSSLAESATSSQKWKRRFLDTTGKRSDSTY